MTATDEAPAPVRVTREDDSRFYPYPPTGEQLDSVTTVISATDSKPWVKKWYGASAMAWAVDNMSVLAQALRSDGRQAAIDLGKDAAEELRGVKRDAGTYVHDVQEALILWAASPGRTGADIALPVLPEHLENAWYDDEPLVDVVDWMVDGFLAFVTDFSPVIEATEMAVYNQPLGIAGTLDAILTLTGYAVHPDGDRLIACPGGAVRLCVDTKTGRSPEGTWKEQLAAYRRMTECQPDPVSGLHPMPPTDAAAVLHLRPSYPDGYLLMMVAGPADEAAWERFSRAASVYRERQIVRDKPGASIRPLRPDGTMPGPRLCDLAGEGYGRALSPLARALGPGAELEVVASFTAAELLAVKGVGPKLIDATREMLAGQGLYLRGEEPAPLPGTAEQAVA